MSIFDGHLSRREAWLVLIAALLVGLFFGLAMGDQVWVSL